MNGLQFYGLLIVFQTYQDDGRVIMKGCVQWNPVYGWKNLILPTAGLGPGTAKSAGKHLNYYVIRAPTLIRKITAEISH